MSRRRFPYMALLCSTIACPAGIAAAAFTDTFENDTGPDDANHAQDDLLIMRAEGVAPGPREGMHLLDVSVGGQTPQQQQQQFTRNDSSQNGGQFAGFNADDSADAKAANVTTINTDRLFRAGVDAYA